MTVFLFYNSNKMNHLSSIILNKSVIFSHILFVAFICSTIALNPFLRKARRWYVQVG